MRYCITIAWIIGLMLISCKTDNINEITRNSLVGEWSVLDALRNGRRTTTLKDGFMRFKKEGRLVTNILGRETTSNYLVEGSTISSDGDFEYSFEIEKLSGDTLLLSGKMKAFEMVFYLMKQEDISSGILREAIQEASGQNVQFEKGVNSSSQ